MCDKTCIFFFFPIINKYFLMAKRSLLSRCPSYVYVFHCTVNDVTESRVQGRVFFANFVLRPRFLIRIFIGTFPTWNQQTKNVPDTLFRRTFCHSWSLLLSASIQFLYVLCCVIAPVRGPYACALWFVNFHHNSVHKRLCNDAQMCFTKNASTLGTLSRTIFFCEFCGHFACFFLLIPHKWSDHKRFTRMLFSFLIKILLHWNLFIYIFTIFYLARILPVVSNCMNSFFFIVTTANLQSTPKGAISKWEGGYDGKEESSIDDTPK